MSDTNIKPKWAKVTHFHGAGISVGASSKWRKVVDIAPPSDVPKGEDAIYSLFFEFGNAVGSFATRILNYDDNGIQVAISRIDGPSWEADLKADLIFVRAAPND